MAATGRVRTTRCRVSRTAWHIASRASLRAAARQAAGGMAVSLLAVSTASAQLVTEARIQELIRAAAQRAGVDASTGPTAGTDHASASGGSQPTVSLTLDDAIKLALERNLDIAVQRLNPQTFDFSLAGLRSTYRPTLSSTVSQQAITTPSTQTISGAAAGTGIETSTTSWNGGIAQNMPWGGGTFQVNLNNNRQTSTALTALFNPVFNPNWAAQFTQPLLRNLKVDNTRQQLVVTKLNQETSEIQLQASIINTISNVRNAYWDYVFAVQSVEVAQRSVALAEQLVADNKTRVEIGTMAPIDVVQAQSQAATQRQNLAQATGARRTAELTLKRLIVSGTQDPNWSVGLEPVDRPEFAPQPIDIEGAVRRALDVRTDLAQARKTLAMNDASLKFLHNQTLPQADLTARYGLIGQGGMQYLSSGQGINRVVTGTLPGGYGDALNTLLRNSFPTWNVALTVSYPIGTSAQDAAVARARVQLSQVEAQMRQIELQIATDVTNAGTQVQNNVERVEAAQAAREFAQRQLEAEQSKFEVGMSTNYFVVQAQRDLATAQNNGLQAVLAYRKSLVELERLQQTTLQNANITILNTNTPGAGGAAIANTAGGGGFGGGGFAR
ncbi:MAG: TolC family protein [Acidimicrobiia bacterium]|nr:TolC family protein [Acidimicrobiia bacterium]